MFSGHLQTDRLKEGESFFKQNYCRLCHTRFAIFFSLPSCCVSSFLFETVVSTVVGGKANKKITSLWFCTLLCVISDVVCMMATDLKTTYFQGQMQEFVEEWLERNSV